VALLESLGDDVREHTESGVGRELLVEEHDAPIGQDAAADLGDPFGGTQAV
jgi:hypothetical protein